MSVSASRLIKKGEQIEGVTDVVSSPVRVNDLIEDIRNSSFEAGGSSFGSLGFGIESRDVVCGERFLLGKIGNHVAEIALVQVISCGLRT